MREANGTGVFADPPGIRLRINPFREIVLGPLFPIMIENTINERAGAREIIGEDAGCETPCQ